MDEKSTIKDLERQASNTKLLMDRLTRAAYGMTFDELIRYSYAQKGSTKVLTDKNLVFNKAMHGQAQSHWFEASKAENLEKWVRVSDKAVKHDL